MKLIEVFLVAVLVGAASFVEAADQSPAGKWKLVVYKDDGTPNAVKQYVLELRVNGEKLTGTFTRIRSKAGDKEPVIEGTIKDGKVRFGQKARLAGPTIGETVHVYIGNVEKDKMQGEHHTGLYGQTTFTKWEATRITDKDMPP